MGATSQRAYESTCYAGNVHSPSTVINNGLGGVYSVGGYSTPIYAPCNMMTYDNVLYVKVFKNGKEIYTSDTIYNNDDVIRFYDKAECIINSALWDFPKSISSKNIRMYDSKSDPTKYCKVQL